MRCILSYSQPIESLEIPFLATNFPFLVGATVLALLGFFRESVALMICGLVSLVFHFWQCVDGQGSCRVQFCLVGDFLACGLMGAVTVGYASRSLTDLSICVSLPLVLLSAGSVSLLFLSWVPWKYTYTHGVWHVAAAVILCVSNMVLHEPGGVQREGLYDWRLYCVLICLLGPPFTLLAYRLEKRKRMLRAAAAEEDTDPLSGRLLLAPVSVCTQAEKEEKRHSRVYPCECQCSKVQPAAHKGNPCGSIQSSLLLPLPSTCPSDSHRASAKTNTTKREKRSKCPRRPSFCKQNLQTTTPNRFHDEIENQSAQVSPAPAAPRCTHRNEQEEAEAQERVWTLTPSSEATDTLPMPPSDVDDTEDHGAVETESEIETETETERRADLPLLQAPSFCQGKEKEEENEEEEFAEGEESLPLSLSLSLSVPLCAVCGGTLGISAVHGDSQTSIASAATTATAAASPRD